MLPKAPFLFGPEIDSQCSQKHLSFLARGSIPDASKSTFPFLFDRIAYKIRISIIASVY
jgi:hypothetical protein